MLHRYIYLFIWGFMSLSTFKGHITMDSWKGRGNQYIQFVRVLYCKWLTNGKQLPAFPLEAMPGTEPQPQRWEARVLPLCHRGPKSIVDEYNLPRKYGRVLIYCFCVILLKRQTDGHTGLSNITMPPFPPLSSN